MIKEVGVNKVVIGDSESYYSPNKDTVTLLNPASYKSGLSTLSHELGHASSLKGNSVSNKVGRALHKGYSNIIIPGENLIDGVSLLNSMRSGIHSARQERKGKKEGLLSKHSTWLLPALKNGIRIGAEYDATRNGLKLLKKHGASDELIKETRKMNGLNGALGSYAGAAIKDVAKNILTRQGSKLLAKTYYKWKDSRDTGSDKD